MNTDEMERQFVAEGWGNGSLHPRVVHNPMHYWDGGQSENDFYVGFDFHRHDWEALFWTALNAARLDEYVQGEDIIQYHERNRQKFEDSIPDYPFLGRIFDMYEDAVYEASEVEPLRNECVKAQGASNDERSIRALSKVMLACDKAIERNLGLLFISD